MTAETHKTAAELNIEKAELRNIINQLAKEMKLRQWAVEQSIKVCVAQNADYYPTKEFIESVTQYFYDFVSKAE